MVQIIVHHAVADARSAQVLNEEFMEICRCLAAGQPHSLPTPPLQFSDYAFYRHEWSQTDAAKNARRYWEQQLAGSTLLKPPSALLDETRHVANSPRQLTSSFLPPLKELARSQGTTLFVVALTAFVTALYKWTRAPDQYTTVASLGRDDPRLERAVGCFFETWLLRVPVDEQTPFIQLLRTVHRLYTEALTVASVSIFEVMKAMSRPDVRPLLSLFNYNAVNAPEPGGTHSIDGAHLDSALPTGLAVTWHEYRNALYWSMHNIPEMISDNARDLFAHDLHRILSTVARDPQVRIMELLIDEYETGVPAQVVPAST